MQEKASEVRRKFWDAAKTAKRGQAREQIDTEKRDISCVDESFGKIIMGYRGGIEKKRRKAWGGGTKSYRWIISAPLVWGELFSESLAEKRRKGGWIHGVAN